MEHTVILSASLVIFSWILIRLYYKHRELPLLYFRNFFVLWSFYSIAHGMAEIFFLDQPYIHEMINVFIVPIFYVACAYLAKLPFIVYNKKIELSQIIFKGLIVLGLLFSITQFLQIQQMIGSLGIFSGIFEHVAHNMLYYRISTAVAVFVFAGLFFFNEFIRSREFMNRMRVLLLGIGFFIGAISEFFHIQGKHVGGSELYVLGFFLICGGILYSFWGVTKSKAPPLDTDNEPLA